MRVDGIDPIDIDPFEALLGLVKGLADYVREMSDEEVLAEFREEGGDPEVSADEARQFFLEDLRDRFVVKS